MTAKLELVLFVGEGSGGAPDLALLRFCRCVAGVPKACFVLVSRLANWSVMRGQEPTTFGLIGMRSLRFTKTLMPCPYAKSTFGRVGSKHRPSSGG